MPVSLLEETEEAGRCGSESSALALDDLDELRVFREEFLVPERAGVYLCGNSLGLQPRGARAEVLKELDAWARFGVEGHFAGSRPWVTIDEVCVEDMASVVGALPSEVATMNSLTVNLHLMMISFYRPTAERNKILIESKAFPSDLNAVVSQVKEKGFDPEECVLKASPREGEESLRTEDIEKLIEKNKDSLALVMFAGVQYYTGQAFEMEKIVKAVRGHCGEEACKVGFDLAHAVGNIELRLHDWDVDFACWCSYKYLNSGPGGIGGCFVHSKFDERSTDIPRLNGWWGHRKEDRFKMGEEFLPAKGAFAWQLSNPPVLVLATLRASLDVFKRAGMPRLRAKSVALTRYLELLIETQLPKGACRSITPGFGRKNERGAQLSLVFSQPVKKVHDQIESAGVICDLREPDVMRIAPAPLYNSFHDIWKFVSVLKEALLNTR